MGITAAIFQNQGILNPRYSISSHIGSFLIPFVIGCLSYMIIFSMALEESRKTMIRECAQGDTFILLSTYFLAKIIPELIINFIIATEIVVILYWSVGWFGHFWVNVLAYFLVFETSASYVYFLVMVFTGDVAKFLGVLVILPQFFFIGTFIPVVSLTSWLQWLAHVCTLKYGLNIMILSEFDLSLCDNNIAPSNICTQWNALKGANLVEEQGQWWYSLILVLFVVAYRILALFVLYYKIRKSKRVGE